MSWTPRYSVCAPKPGSQFVDAIFDTNDELQALEFAAEKRAAGVECRTYDWKVDHPSMQVIDAAPSLHTNEPALFDLETTA